MTNVCEQLRGVSFYELDDVNDTMAEDIREGLLRRQKSIPPKYFYDKKGSELFDAITRLPEYYLSRTETMLLEQNMEEIVGLVGQGSTLYELGSGSSIKSRLLLEASRPRRYVPIDISRDHLMASTNHLAKDYPWIEIHAVCADYSHLRKLPELAYGRCTAFFPGSSIGNCNPDSALAQLTVINRLLGPGGGLLIGVDLKKDARILERAYNDASGITAKFNLNMLAHINTRLGADFELDNFAHNARYDAGKGRVEMHLTSKSDALVRIGTDSYLFNAGETIHTESSYKYSVDEFTKLAAKAGFASTRVWSDSDRLFSIHYLTVP